MAQHNELGKKGEQLAIDYLAKKGYKILEKIGVFKKQKLISSLKKMKPSLLLR